MAELNSEGRYTDLPHTIFPQAADDEAGHPLMQDISGNLFNAAKSYSAAISQGNAFGAQSVLEQNPDLINTMFTADKYNWMRDAIIATQRYYVSDVQDMITEIAQHSIGIDDNNTNGQPDVNGYSISKITSIIKGTSTTHDLTSSNWSNNRYVIQLDGVTSTDNIDVSLSPQATQAQAKAWSKAMVLCATQSTNSITLISYGKITADVTIPIVVTVHK